jgi:hypothetical protein
MVILSLFFNFAILPLLFSNEDAVYPYFLTPLIMVGLNGKKKEKKEKRQVDQKIAMPLKGFPTRHSLELAFTRKNASGVA